jgi:hypothetical protein
MAHHSIVHGRIKGPNWQTKDYYRLHKINESRLGELPELDLDYPWINQSMFNIPNEQGVFRDQVITFGASYKNLECDWHLWLEKFEAVLRKLYWIDVSIYVQFEVMGSYEYHWSLTNEEHARCLFDEPTAIENWTFESTGPRSFEEML